MLLFLNFRVSLGDDGVHVFVEGAEGLAAVVSVQTAVFVGVRVLSPQLQTFLENPLLGDGLFDGDTGALLAGDVVVEFLLDVSVVEVVLVPGYVVHHTQELPVVVLLLPYVHQAPHKHRDGTTVSLSSAEKKNYVIFTKKIKTNNPVAIYST